MFSRICGNKVEHQFPQHEEYETRTADTLCGTIPVTSNACRLTVIIRSSRFRAHKKDRDDSPNVPWWKRLRQGFTFRAGHDRDQNAQEVDVDRAIAGRTRVNRSGREATKAARKEAKKRAKEEFKLSREASEAQETRQRLKSEVRKNPTSVG